MRTEDVCDQCGWPACKIGSHGLECYLLAMTGSCGERPPSSVPAATPIHTYTGQLANEDDDWFNHIPPNYQIPKDIHVARRC